MNRLIKINKINNILRKKDFGCIKDIYDNKLIFDYLKIK